MEAFQELLLTEAFGVHRVRHHRLIFFRRLRLAVQHLVLSFESVIDNLFQDTPTYQNPESVPL